MDVMEVLRTRRTFRAFTQEPVPQEVLMDILEAGRLANCGANRQSLRFAVAQKPEDVAKLCELTKWAAAIPNGAGTPAPEQRPTLYIVILQDTSVTGYSDIDVGIAVAGMTTASSEPCTGRKPRSFWAFRKICRSIPASPSAIPLTRARW